MHTVCGGASERKTCTSALRGLLLFPLSPRWGDDPFLGGFFFIFFRPHQGALSQPGFTPAFAGIFLSARAGIFILRELAEFG